MILSTLDRRRVPEVMDEPGLDAGRHHSALRGLARINFVSASAGILWRPLSSLARRIPGRPLRVLDVATASGDVPIRLWKRAQRARIAIEIDGCDHNLTAIEFAKRQAAAAGASIGFFQLDALRDEFPTGYDAIICSLFLHHLDESEAVEYLRRAGDAAARLVLVNDLQRSRPGLALAHIAPWLFFCGAIVRVDAPRSVWAAYTPAEASTLADRAGLPGAAVSRRWPCRYLLKWERRNE